RLARRYLSDYHEAEDVVIIVFNKALKNITHFEYRGEGSLRRWLNTIAINECIKTIKKIRPINYQEEIMDTSSKTLVSPNIDIEMVYLILEKMPRGYRTVFNLYAIDGYSHSEIAEALSISRNTSKSQLLKARRFIINELNKRKAYGT
ncbi:MAG: sigma-70 family RNA polymerase sigma factor, partial [Bacteroidota bacterium]